MADGPELFEVRLVGLPVAVRQRAAEANDELMREFALIVAGQPDATHEVPARLLALAEDLNGRFSGFTVASQSEMAAAVERGDDTVDLVFRLPADVVDGVRRLQALLDEADEFCRAGQELLTLASSDETKAFRDWFLDELAGQIEAGRPPHPWSPR